MQSLQVLALSNFRRFFAAQSLSMFGNIMALIAMPFAILEIGGSAAGIGVALASRYVPVAALIMIGGVLADRIDRRKLMVATDLARCVVQLTAAVLLVRGELQMWHIVLLQAVFGAAEALFVPALRGIVPQLVPPAQQRQGNALVSMSLNCSRIVGPIISGLLVTMHGAWLVVAFDGVTFLASAVLLMCIKPFRRGGEKPSLGAAQVGLRRDVLDGWREVKSRLWLCASLVNMMVFGALAEPAIRVLGPELAVDKLGGVHGWSLLTSMFGIGALLGGTAALRWRPTHPAAACTLSLLVVAFYPVALVGGRSLEALAGVGLVAGAAISTASIFWASLLQNHIPEKAISRVSAIDSLCTLVPTTAGYLTAGQFADSFGLHRSMLLFPLISIASSLTVFSVPAIRRLRWHAEKDPVKTTIPTAA